MTIEAEAQGPRLPLMAGMEVINEGVKKQVC